MTVSVSKGREAGFYLIDLLISLAILGVSLLGYGLLNGVMLRDNTHLYLELVASRSLSAAVEHIRVIPPCAGVSTPGCTDIAEFGASYSDELIDILPGGQMLAAWSDYRPGVLDLTVSWRQGEETRSRTAGVVL